MKDINYYAITYGGVPMTPQGVIRFITAATEAGHKYEEIYNQIPDRLKGCARHPDVVKKLKGEE